MIWIEAYRPIAEAIRARLVARNWTQDDLATVIGCTPGTITRLTTGKANLSLRMVAALAAAFDDDAYGWIRLRTEAMLADR